jgi:hypothetical protein
MFEWIKQHFELLGGFFFGLGGVYVQHQHHGKEIVKLKDKQEQYSEDISDIKGMLQRIDERTKKL